MIVLTVNTARDYTRMPHTQTTWNVLGVDHVIMCSEVLEAAVLYFMAPSLLSIPELCS